MPNPNLPINARMNTYIGARYVPKFANPAQWSNTLSYEPLTIVVYQGNSYTSTTFVPVGVDINNTDYWALTGNYNAQVELYRQQVIDALSDIDTFKELFVDPLYNVNMIAIGDSFAQPSTSWMQMIKDSLNLTEGLNFYSSATGGDGFCQGTTFQAHLQTISAQITDKSQITHIVVIGGINDTKEQYNSAFASAVSNFIKYARVNFPKAKVYIGYNATLYRQADYPTIQTLKPFYDYWIANACANYGAIAIPNINYTLADCWDMVDSDFVHPTQKGQNAIYTIVMNALFGSYLRVSPNYQLNSKQITYEGFTLNVQFSNYAGTPTLIINQGDLTSTPGSITTSAYTQISDINEFPLFPGNLFRTMIDIVYDTDSGKQTQKVLFTISRTNVTLIAETTNFSYNSLILRNSIIVPCTI